MPGFDAQLSRKRIKNINVRIDRTGHVRVSAPLKCPLDYIQQFLQKKQSWIMKQRTRLCQLALSVSPTLKSGEPYLFLGQPYSFVIKEHAGFNNVVLEDSQLHCYLRTVATDEIKHNVIAHWQREQMQALLPALIQKWESIVGVHANEWVIRAMKTRWGTCHIVRKRICLNLHLIQYPLSCLEYVVVHELVHLLEASHNQRFYELMTQFMPNWKKYRSLLKYQ